MRALTATGPSPGATRLTDTAMQILRDAGLTEAVAVQTFTTTYLIFVGWLATRNLAEGNGVHPRSLRREPVHSPMTATNHSSRRSAAC